MSADKTYKNIKTKAGRQLYDLLPEVYRSRDSSESKGQGDLAKFLDACGELLDLLRRTNRFDDPRHQTADRIEGDRTVRTGEELGGCPTQRLGSTEASQALRNTDEMPTTIVECIEALLDAGGQFDVAIDQLEFRTIGLYEALGEILGRESIDFSQHVHGGVVIDLFERRFAEILIDPVRLEQVELDVPKVALVVAH